jgi:hypothetical protein
VTGGRGVRLYQSPGSYGESSGEASDGGPVAIAGVERERLIVLDLGQGDVIGIRIFSHDPARFDALVAQAMPIIESIQFE